ncbi:MAG: M1 family metallopeptidase, partial [Chloroflexi bacterium]|nr:M1 family metallopeptidase [Chloroflexota bacterium]
MSTRLPLCRSLLPALFALFLAAAAPSVAMAGPTRPHYDLQVSLNFGQATLDVVQRTTLRNNTGVDLPDLVFQVTPAFYDAFSLKSASVGGEPVAASLDGTVLTLNLGTPLAANAFTDVELRYRIVVPPSGGRFGRGQGILALGNWFPVLAVYQDGWDRHQYVDVGDAFFTEVADFDVAVTADTPVTISASGPMVGQDGQTQTFHADSVRDFAMAVSDRYQVRTRDVDGIKVAAYGLNPSRLEGYLNTAEKTLRWFSANLAPYPYPTLSIAETRGQDFVPTLQEYPGMIMAYDSVGDDGGGPGSYSEYILAHEVAHQWFYSLVGDDQVHDPWLDEAMATYADILFYRDQYPNVADSLWQRRVVAQYRARAAEGGDRPVNTSIYDYPDDVPYFDNVYRKGAIFLDKLQGLMGRDAFLGLLRDYVATYANKVAYPRAFLDMAYQRTGDAVPPLVAQYFTYGAFSDGAGYQLAVDFPDQFSLSAPATLTYQ